MASAKDIKRVREIASIGMQDAALIVQELIEPLTIVRSIEEIALKLIIEESAKLNWSIGVSGFQRAYRDFVKDKIEMARIIRDELDAI